jgi:lysozyme
MSDKGALAAKVGAGTVAILIPIVVYFEGTIPRAYRDPIGIITSCTGHTGPELKMGQTFTPEECRDQLEKDLLAHSAALNCVPGDLAPHEKAAIISFSFNVGNAAFCKSTMARRFNEHNSRAACAELSRWTIAGGRELPGLVKRRAAERAVCEGKAWKPA